MSPPTLHLKCKWKQQVPDFSAFSLYLDLQNTAWYMAGPQQTFVDWINEGRVKVGEGEDEDSGVGSAALL